MMYNSPRNTSFKLSTDQCGVCKCGGCKCSNCPVPGSLFSFKEQRELNLIKKNLVYNVEEKLWYTRYPWKFDRSALPMNDKKVLKLLQSLERSLQEKPEVAKEYSEQIQSIVERGVAVLLSEEEMKAWKVDYYYLPQVGMESKYKPLRISLYVFALMLLESNVAVLL